MALNRGNLGFTTQVSMGSSFPVYVVGSGQTTYIKGIILHNTSETLGTNARIHVVENNGGAIAAGDSTTAIAYVGVATAETYFFEPAYPITLENNGDCIYIENASAIGGDLNILILGDKEA